MCDRHSNGLGAAIQNLFGQAAEAGPLPEPAPRAPRRLKLWELEDRYHCPVVGTCLTLAEIKKIAHKSGFEGRNFDEYRLHVEAVSVSCSRNPAAEAMHKLLDRKFETYLRRFESARTPEAVGALWRQHLEQGEVAGALWAALTHKAGDADIRHRVYGDVHMLSHQIGAGQAADLRRLEWLEREHARVQAEYRNATNAHARELAQRDARIRELERAAAETWQRAQEASPLRRRLEELESGVAMTGMARRLLDLSTDKARLASRNAELERRLEELSEHLSRVETDLTVVATERDALERLWALGAETEPACDGQCQACPCPGHLEGRCVLCVGGRTPLLPQYRQLAERLGVRLIHHDGGREEALSRLPALLASSDAVICPTDCVGHLAYYQLKQHCKQAGKPCVLVKSSGVASFAAALARLAEGRAEIQAS